MTLAEFLAARIAEDEKIALRISPGRNADNAHWRANSLEFSDVNGIGFHDKQTTRHIVRWDPARVLAECEAKRRVVQIAEDQIRLAAQDHRGWDNWRDMAWQILRALALLYAGHPDYQPEWKP